MEGLEVSEVSISELDLSDRFDAEYVAKENLRIETLISHLPHKKLGALCELTASAFYPSATELYGDTGLPFLRCVDCINYPLISVLQDEEFERLPESFIEENGSIRLAQKGDIVITKVGSPCYASLVHEHEALALSRTVLGATHIKDVDPYYLTVFLRAHHGFLQLMRQREQTIQFQLTLERVRDVDVFLPSSYLQEAVSTAFKRSFNCQQSSQEHLAQAEQTLLHALGLDIWTPPEALSYVRSSRDAFAAGRLDAEHFHPRFDDLITMMAAKGNCDRLGNHLRFNSRGKQPDYADMGLPVINSKHVLRNEVRCDDANRKAHFDDNSALIKTGDVLINGTGVGTIGRAAAYLHESSALPDNHVTILRPNKSLDPVYLAVFLNSLAGQLQVDQRLHGSSGQIELYPIDIADFQIWLAPQELQHNIRKQVEQSFAQRQRATRLLDAAKRAVEIAIEESESAALQFLQKLM